MRNFLLFTLILVSNYVSACGYYPYGEDTRISIFNPSLFGYDSYSNFYYSALSFSSNGDSSPKSYVLPNNRLWFDYCRGKVDISSIDKAIYHLSVTDIDNPSRNEMIQYLYQQKDSDALNYLRFAKNCEYFNSWQEDPWERKTYLAMPKRTELMNKAQELAKKVQNKELKRRYTFLAIRLAWYNHQYDVIQSLFDSVFEKSSNKDILYYWSLYFKSFTESGSPKVNFQLAQVFANAEDKRFVCHQHYNPKIPIEKTLQVTQTNKEKANVYLLYGIEKPDKALPYLQKMYALDPASNGLSFLLLREVNKVEDYVLTPYYTLFQPSLSYDFWEGKTDTSTRQTLTRSERDRSYAKDILRFLNTADMSKVENPFFWKCCKAYLLFITRDYNGCLTLIENLEKSLSKNAILNQLHIIKALALTANQKNGNAHIPLQTQSIIISNQTNSQFIFSIGKELEYLGNTTDAALLYAKLDASWEEGLPVFWKTIKTKNHFYNDYFVNYFEYADAIYTSGQTEHLIKDIQNHFYHHDSFDIFKYGDMRKDIPRLYDLLGTKYVRQNKLANALATFKNIDNRYWYQAYTGWGDRSSIFDQNPFYHLKYTPEFITTKDTIRLNKYTITKQLMDYLLRAENKNEDDRDYYYFLVANAYYNMGSQGNVSMMRRLQSWSGEYPSVIEDEAEFRQSNLAKKYYLLASEYAKTDKFKALCLRMIIRCEKNKLHDQYQGRENQESNVYDSLLASNQYRRELHDKYPEYYQDLVSNCEKFSEYFNARRQ